MRCKRYYTAHDEVLPCGQVAAQELEDHVVHHLRMKHLSRKREQQDHEGEERQDHVGRHAEREGMHLGAYQILRSLPKISRILRFQEL